jgi:hypothetical protein
MLRYSMTSRAAATELRNTLDYLLNESIAIFVNPIIQSPGWVSWPEKTNEPFLLDRSVPSCRDYRNWIRNGMYSAILFDGSLLQCSYRYGGPILVGHRLSWVPAPFTFDAEDLLTESIVDLLDLHLDGRPNDVVLRTPVRFDFDSEAAKPGHPASHLTLNFATCRIACRAPVRLGRFLEFVFGHFYPDIWAGHPYLQSLPRDGDQATLSDDERAGVHLAWSA